jgi:hypothetical protein
MPNVADGVYVGPSALTILRKTASAGVPLTGATPTILSWTAPADGNPHAFAIPATLAVTTLLVGGAVAVTWTTGGVLQTSMIFAGGEAPGTYTAPASLALADPGTTVSVVQSSALTGGAGNVQAAILAE